MQPISQEANQQQQEGVSAEPPATELGNAPAMVPGYAARRVANDDAASVTSPANESLRSPSAVRTTTQSPSAS